jgi:hypothetical protein
MERRRIRLSSGEEGYVEDIREGIEIPFPIRTVHLHRTPPGAGAAGDG